jgi:ATP synthase F1 delta subunit
VIGSAVGRRYGRALFESAVKKGDVKAVEGDLEALIALIEGEPAFRRFLASPRVTEAEKSAFLQQHFKGRLAPLTMSLLQLLVEKRRLRDLPLIAQAYRELHREAQGIVDAEVASAHPLDPEITGQIRKQLERITGKTVSLREAHDPSLLGGVKVVIGEKLIDGSVAFHMKRLREALLGVRVH